MLRRSDLYEMTRWHRQSKSIKFHVLRDVNVYAVYFVVTLHTSTFSCLLVVRISFRKYCWLPWLQGSLGSRDSCDRASLLAEVRSSRHQMSTDRQTDGYRWNQFLWKSETRDKGGIIFTMSNFYTFIFLIFCTTHYVQVWGCGGWQASTALLQGVKVRCGV